MGFVRIVGGALRGRRLRVPDRGVRPTSERSREAVFDILGTERIAGARVLALGAGVVGRAENREALARDACVVLLSVDAETAVARLSRAPGPERPLLRGAPTVERLGALLWARGPSYDAAADFAVDTRGRAPAEVAEAIVPLWESFLARWASSGS